MPANAATNPICSLVQVFLLGSCGWSGLFLQIRLQPKPGPFSGFKSASDNKLMNLSSPVVLEYVKQYTPRLSNLSWHWRRYCFSSPPLKTSSLASWPSCTWQSWLETKYSSKLLLKVLQSLGSKKEIKFYLVRTLKEAQNIELLKLPIQWAAWSKFSCSLVRDGCLGLSCKLICNLNLNPRSTFITTDSRDLFKILQFCLFKKIWTVIFITAHSLLSTFQFTWNYIFLNKQPFLRSWVFSAIRCLYPFIQPFSGLYRHHSIKS